MTDTEKILLEIVQAQQRAILSLIDSSHAHSLALNALSSTIRDR